MEHNVILCHKCAGLLLGDLPYKSHGCICISGYVRGWQVPISASEALTTQRETLAARLELYKGQKRSPRESAVIWITEMLNRLNNIKL